VDQFTTKPRMVTADGDILQAGQTPKLLTAYRTGTALLFRGTVMSNLCIGTQAMVEEVEALLQREGLLTLLNSLNLRLDTLVDDTATNLSRGQQQAIDVGRLILQVPDVVVLDECLTHLDFPHRRMLLEVVDRALGDKVVIVISHDLSLVDRRDNVVWLKEGQLIHSNRPLEMRMEHFE